MSLFLVLLATCCHSFVHKSFPGKKVKAYNTGLIGNLSLLSPCKRPILIASGLIFSSMGLQDCKNLQIETYVRYIPDLVGKWEVGKLEHWVRWNARPFIEFSGYVYAQSAMCCWCLALLSRDFSQLLYPMGEVLKNMT